MGASPAEAQDAGGDSTRPAVIAATVEAGPYDVSATSATVNGTIHASDDLAGVSSVVTFGRSPSQQQLLILNGNGGSATDVEVEITGTLPGTPNQEHGPSPESTSKTLLETTTQSEIPNSKTLGTTTINVTNQPANLDCVNSPTIVTDVLPEVEAAFGTAVAMTDNAFAVTTHTSQRAVVFTCLDGQLIGTAIDHQPDVGDGYGLSVALSDSTVAVGALFGSTANHNRSGYVILSTLTGGYPAPPTVVRSPSPRKDEFFGRAVAMTDELLAIGAPGSGRIYLYHRAADETWQYEETLNAEASGAAQAIAISPDNNHIAVGMTHNDAAYLFTRHESSWVSKRVAIPPELVLLPHSSFGASVDVDTEGRLLVGAPAMVVDEEQMQVGGAFLYESTGDELLLKGFLNGPELSRFGTGVVIRDSELLVSAPGARTPSGRSGAVYRINFELDIIDVMDPPPGTGSDRRGAHPLSATENRIIYGNAYATTDTGYRAGEAWLIDLPPLDTTAPTVTPHVSDPDGLNGWYVNAPVEITWTTSDPAPSSGGITDPPTTSADIEGTTSYTSDSVCDNAGNCALGTATVKIDSVAPAIQSLQISTNPTPVSVPSVLTVVAVDATSGLAEVELQLDGHTTLTSLDASGSAELDLGDSLPPGVYPVIVRVRDNAGNWSGPLTEYLVIYDPAGGWATGSGWIVPGGETSEPGDWLPNLDGTSRAQFGFLAKYQAGQATIPTGNLRFRYLVRGTGAPFVVSDAGFDWLVVTNTNWARFRGLVTIDGTDELFPVQVEARDSTNQPDRFIIKIWAPQSDPDVDEPIYKASGDVTGNIKVHQP